MAKNQNILDCNSIKFLDESSINIGMTPIYAWGMKSERI